MSNRYPMWKNLLVIVMFMVGLIYTLPNIYPEDPIVQISGASVSGKIDESVLKKAQDALDKSALKFKSSELSGTSGIFRFENGETQLLAKDLIKTALGDDYVVALNLAPTTPAWLRALGANPMNLGLDLRGGVHFLLEVDMSKVLEPRMTGYIEEIRSGLRKEGVRYRAVKRLESQKIALKFDNEDEQKKADDWIKQTFREGEFVLSKDTMEGSEEFYLQVELSKQKLKEIQDYAISQNLTALRNRVNELGVAEPIVQRQGVDRIVVELPGVQDTAEAKRILGRTASLEFRLADDKSDLSAAMNGRVPFRSELFPFKEKRQMPVLVERNVILTGDRVVGAVSGFDENGQPQVSITLDGSGGTLMNRATRDNVGRRMAVIFVEHKERTLVRNLEGRLVSDKERYVEKYAINVATIQSALGHSFRITGLDNVLEAKELALLLRAGALAAPMYFAEERTIGPSLGKENIKAGFTSVLIGFVLVVVFMLAYYRLFGLFANMALLLNVLLIFAVMSFIDATLTLPGIAGIVLTLGMAVDANVLINSRIKEELGNNFSPQKAISQGYDRAFITILDSNITTLLVAFILFAVGTGPVKGFAVTLSIGIMCSMFTAIVGTRALVNLVYGGRIVESISIGRVSHKKLLKTEFLKR
jgi:preprotein translocase subunit SecD